MSKSNQNTNSLFGDVSKYKGKTAEDQIEEKMLGRVDELFKPKTSSEDYREEITSSEIRLRKTERESLFRGKRLQQNIKIDYSTSLKEKLTIPIEVYNECNAMKVKVKFIIFNINLGRRFAYLHCSI
jgi:hypothetical protein